MGYYVVISEEMEAFCANSEKAIYYSDSYPVAFAWAKNHANEYPKIQIVEYWDKIEGTNNRRGEMSVNDMLAILARDWLVELTVENENDYPTFTLTIEMRGGDEKFVYSATTIERVVGAAYAGEPTRVG